MALGIDILDLIVLAAILGATVAYFTKGTLWARPEVDKYAGGLGGGKFGASASSRDIIEKLDKNDKNLVVFYGSQTGTAEDYASRVAKEASQRFGLKAMTADCEDYDFENLDVFPEDKVVGFVMATYGEGEPTDNAQQFYEFVTSEDASFSEGNDDAPLSKLNYVIFGLGNNTYEHFNEVGRKLDAALQRLGAHRIGPYGEGDDGKGTMEEDYLAWKDEVFTQWQEEKGLEEREAVYEPTLEISEQPDHSAEEERVFVGEYNKQHLEGAVSAPFNANNPCLVTVSESRELFNSKDRNCIHLELDIADTGLKYTTGDHLAFWTQNSDEEVDRFLSVLGLYDKREACIDVKSLDPTAKVPFPVPTTYDTVVRYYLEINGPVSRQFVHQIAPFAPSEAAKKKAIQLGTDKELFHEQVTAKYYNIARLLLDISEGEQWTGVPFSFIVETINHMVPRYYSISSSSLVDKSRISITAVVESVKPDSADHELKGVATNYILDLKQAAAGEQRSVKYNLTGPRGKYISGSVTKVPVHVRHSNFKLPTNPQKPIIMVGPGTGIAPFRGFIHERAHQSLKGTSVGRAVLFSGCRRSDEDNLYGDEWAKHSGEHDGESDFGHSNFLTVINAFSREGPKKVYVQHRMEENAVLIDSLIKQGAFFYVCGDAQRMARDVQATLTKIISTQRSIPLEKAERIVKNMKTQNTYQEDVW